MDETDTDGDGLSDKEEIELGVNPLGDTTPGASDNQVPFTQKADKDSEIFDEELQMSVPVETMVSEDGTNVYANIDNLGTYFVMDIVTWFEMLGIEAEPEEKEELDTLSKAGAGSSVSSMESELLDENELQLLIDAIKADSEEAHTYLAVSQPLLWQEAKLFCEAIGGHLVTIYDEEVEGKWKWIAGAEAEQEEPYLNFSKGEPNNGSAFYAYQNHYQYWSKNPTKRFQISNHIGINL